MRPTPSCGANDLRQEQLNCAKNCLGVSRLCFDHSGAGAYRQVNKNWGPARAQSNRIIFRVNLLIGNNGDDDGRADNRRNFLDVRT